MSWFSNLFRRQPQKVVPVKVRAKYDAAQNSDDTARHWANADSLSARAANSAEVRQKLRNRSRYEAANNSYCDGMLKALSNDTIGTGPRLQVNTGNPEANRKIEAAFARWCARIRLPEKLRTIRRAKAVDGEVFCLFTTDRRAGMNEVQLDLRVVEADQVCGAQRIGQRPNDRHIDGIDFDEDWNPTRYHVYRRHPGDNWWSAFRDQDFDLYDASRVAHLFNCERPGQVRGIPEVTPAIPLFAQLRRYTLAVIAAAETAADFAAVMYTDSAAIDPDDVDPLDSVDLYQRMMTTLPRGWKLGQIKAEQPTTTHGDFVRTILREISRCLQMPINIVLGDSSDHNYASGRLDHKTYYRSIGVEQSYLAAALLDRLFREWLDEALLIEGGPLADIGVMADLTWGWIWPGFEHVDPQKEASAQAQRLASLTTTLATEAARQGWDWEEMVEQIARERKKLAELGLPMPGEQPMANQDSQLDNTDDEESDAEQAKAA